MRHLFSTFILMLVASVSLQAQSFPQDNAVYRLVNAGRTNAVMTEDVAAHNIYCTDKGSDDSYNQLWLFKKSGNGWNIQNVFTGQYVQQQSTTYALFTTATTPVTLYVSENSTIAGNYNIVNASGGNWGMHCDASYNVVPWYSGSNTPGGSEWVLESVEISIEEFNAARAKYDEFNNTLSNKDEVIAGFTKFFENDECTVLKSEYAAMSDDELAAAMSGCSATLIEIAKKIKNDSWAAREKEFRVHTYEPYSNPEHWAEILNTKIYSWLSNPTGIYANTADVVYVFVGKEPKQGSTLEIDAISGNGHMGTRTALKKGMNIIPVSRDAQSLFIIYKADTRNTYTLSDFDSIPIHVEGGVVNGYWDKSRHTDSDWVDITRNLATHKYMLVKGDHVLFFMNKQYLTADNCCKNTITDAIGWWDNMAVWQQELMGLEDYKPSRFNNKLCAVTTTSGYQSAGNYTTNYVETYITNLLPYKNVMAGGDNVWGPAHENGHVHQATINMIACSEVSNNLFSNRTLYGLGKYMSRGGKISEIADAFTNNIAWPSRDGGITLRMYWQLYLYYHVAGNNPQFYPTLFKLLREDPLKKSSGGTVNYGRKDLLHFAKKCSEAAGEDLTDFFEAWGFFVPMTSAQFDDYGTYVLTSSTSMIKDAKKELAKFTKRAGAIQFIEDRVLPVPRTDGVEGNKLNNGVAVGEAGDLGHFTAFVPDSMNVVPQGYVYTKAGKSVVVSKGNGAVGFKVYDADSTLLTFCNTLTINLTDEMAAKGVYITAVSANGTEVVVRSKNEGTEEEQLEALNEALASAQGVLKLKDSGNKYVGYYYESALLQLTSLVESARASVENKDQSVNTYGAWATLIDEEINSLLSRDDVKVKIHSGNSYQLENIKYPGYTMYYNSGSLVCKSGTNNTKMRSFTFVTTNKADEYYILSNGYYVSSVATSTLTAMKTTSKNTAVKFTVENVADAKYAMYKTGDKNLALHCDAAKNVVGWSASADASHWIIVCVDQKKEKADTDALNQLIDEATSVYNLIVDTTNTAEITFNEGIEVTSETLAADVESMMAKVAQSQSVISKKYYEQCPALIDELTAIISKVKAGYTVSTGIGAVIYDEATAVIYDARGHKVKRITSPGIYIINGKKVYIK